MKRQPLAHLDWSDSACCGFDIVAGEFVVVTADIADAPPYRPLSALLRRVGRAFGVDVAFVAAWADGEPVVHRAMPRGDDAVLPNSDALQATYGLRLLEAADCHPRAKNERVWFEAVPVVTADGFEHGTLCCRRVVDASDTDHGTRVEALHSVAGLIADWFEDADLSLSGLVPLRGDSMMGSLPMPLN